MKKKEPMNKTEPVREVKEISIIMVTVLRGAGVEGDPYREVTQYWTLSGELIADKDSCREENE